MADSTLTFVNDEGVEFMKLCVDVTLYWRGSAYDHKDGILHFYREAMKFMQPQLKFFEREDMQGAIPATAAAFDELPRWLAGSDPTKDVSTIHLYGGSALNIPSDIAFKFHADEYPEDQAAGMVRVMLPRATVESSGAPLLDRALALASELRFHSGYSGYAINWDPLGELAFDAEKRMGILSRRYPAIELPDVTATLMAIPNGMKRINWTTFVGDALMAEKGLIPEELTGLDVRRLPHGIAVVAGPRPLLGDVNHQEDLSAYHRVGRILAKLRSPDHIAFVSDQNGDPQEDLTEEWLRYFDK